MIRHFNFVQGIATVVAPEKCVLVVESSEPQLEADGTGSVSYSACYKDAPELSYEFVCTGQFRRWLDEQARIRSTAKAA